VANGDRSSRGNALWRDLSLYVANKVRDQLPLKASIGVRIESSFGQPFNIRLDGRFVHLDSRALHGS
jgi:hypothetical protein